MEPDFNYFQIDSKDIWEHERMLYLQNKSPIRKITDIEIKLIDLILSNTDQKFDTKPFADLLRYDSGQLSIKEKNDINRWFAIYSNDRERITLNIFSHHDSFYKLDLSITIAKQNEDFDYWFSLKLSQYKLGLKFISNFLNYHFTNSFSSNADNFQAFLRTIILQYKNEIISDRVVQKVEDWLESKLGKQINFKPVNVVRTIKIKHHTFIIKSYLENSKYFDTKTNEAALNEFWSKLELDGFIRDTKINQFRGIFQSATIKKENRIIWNKSIKALTEFVNILCQSNKIIELQPADKWLITMNCFVLMHFEEIKFDSLSKAQSTSSKFEKEIKEIVGKFLNDIV